MSSNNESYTNRTKLLQLITQELTKSLENPEDAGGLKLIGLNIQSIPPEAIELVKDEVERLSLQQNLLTSLPQYFNRLTNLRYLDLHDNKFEQFPEILTKLTVDLEILDLGFNSLKTIPNDLGNLSKTLKVLSLKNNQLNEIPISILSIKNLQILEIDKNPLNETTQIFLKSQTSKANTNEWLQEVKTFLLTYSKSHDNYIHDSKSYNHHNHNHNHNHNHHQSTSHNEPHQVNEIVKPLPLQSQSQAHIHQGTIKQLERSRSTSEGYVSSRAAKRMGFIIKRPNQTISSDVIKERDTIITHETLDPQRNRSFSTSSVSPIPREPRDFREPSFSGTISSSSTSTSSSSSASLSTTYGDSSTLTKDHLRPIQTRQQQQQAISPTSDKLDSVPEHKSNDYFKRLSILPETRLNNNVSHFKIVDISRKVLFAFSEFNSNLKKMNTFCSDKQILIDLIPQLYSSKNLIDHLVESLEITEENNGIVTIDEILKSVTQTISSFKKIINILSKSITKYIENADVCFIRSLLLSIFLSYSEIYNAYKLLNPDSVPLQTTSSNATYTSTSTKKDRLNQLPPLRIPDQTAGITITQQQLNEYSENDDKLYESLNNALQTSNQVYSELNNAISKTAIQNAKSTSGEIELGDNPIQSNSIIKIKDLTGTCVQSMDLNKKIKLKISNNNVKNFTLIEKKKFYDDINLFLKSIITILGSTKSIMNESSILNEIRPSLASLTKATKDVTIMLEVSSYRLINDSFTNNAPNSSSIQPLMSANSSTSQSTNQPMLSAIPSVMSIPQMNTPFINMSNGSLSNPPPFFTMPTPAQQTSNPFEASMIHNLNNGGAHDQSHDE